LLVIFILPESHPPQSAANAKVPLTRSALRQILLSPTGTLLLLIFIVSFGLSGFQGIMGLYVVDKFGFNTKQVGTIWMVMGGMLIVVQGGLTEPLSKKFGELPLILAGLAGGALGFVGMSLAVDYFTTLLAVALFALALALIGPALNAYLSGFAGEQQGLVMGLNGAAGSLGKVIGPLWAGYLYEVNIENPYLSGAGALLLGLFVCIAGMRAAHRAHQMAAPANRHTPS
jgi:MFS family permease